MADNPTWTYSTDLVLPRDEVRRAIGDVDATAGMLWDQEIAAYLAQANGSIDGAAYLALSDLAARFSRLNPKLADRYDRMAELFRLRAVRHAGGAPSLSLSPEARAGNVPIPFVKGMLQDRPANRPVLPINQADEQSTTQ